MPRPRIPLLPLILCLFTPLPAHAAELRVGSGGYPTLTEAIRAAKPGDTLRVMPGRYPEHLVLDKPLALVGEGMPTVDGGGSGDVIFVKAPGCRISGLHVTGSGREVLSDTAAIKVESSEAIVQDCLLDRCLYGLYLSAIQHSRFERNVIQGLAELPVGDRGDGIRLWNSSHNVIAGNRIEDTRDGIYFDASPFNTVTDNAIRRVRYGLHYMYSDDNVFKGNRFTDTEAGSAVMFSRRITLVDNLFSGNRGYRAYGLLIKDVENSTVEDNEVSGNRTGIFLDGATQVRVARNWVVGNDLGLEVRGSTEGCLFTSNTIAGNTESVATPTGRGENTWQGNYWSDYHGYDLDGDGKGDTPHEAGSVFSYLTENFPPVRLFLMSPAIQALEFAERTFPLVDAPSIEDPAPAMHPTVRRAARPRAGGTSTGLIVVALGALTLGLLPLLLARKAFHA
ncbi:MAG TPA: nitrous oxide reductase family maturation protein NosD [Stenomitos sp.]